MINDKQIAIILYCLGTNDKERHLRLFGMVILKYPYSTFSLIHRSGICIGTPVSYFIGQLSVRAMWVTHVKAGALHKKCWRKVSAIFKLAHVMGIPPPGQPYLPLSLTATPILPLSSTQSDWPRRWLRGQSACFESKRAWVQIPSYAWKARCDGAHLQSLGSCGKRGSGEFWDSDGQASLVCTAANKADRDSQPLSFSYCHTAAMAFHVPTQTHTHTQG